MLNTSIEIRQPMTTSQTYIAPDGSSIFNFTLSFGLLTSTVPPDIAENLTNILDGREHNRTRKQVNLIYEDVEVSAFQPNSESYFLYNHCAVIIRSIVHSIHAVYCSCNTDTETTIHTVCTGPSTPPCVCSSQNCTVSHYFIGLYLLML